MEAIAHDESDFERRASGRELGGKRVDESGREQDVRLGDARVGDASDKPGGDTDGYRKRVLDDIARRVAEEGVHTAVPGDDRGRQFMPFAALKGYDDIVRDSQEPMR